MTYNKEDVLRMVQDMLGEDASGLYISEDEYEYGEECDVLSNVEYFFRVSETSYIDVKKGASKVVLIPRHEDYVIKMPITGIYQIKDLHDPDFTYPEDPDYEIVRTSSYNVLDEEMAMYDDMPELLKTFCKPLIYIGTYHDIPIYIQEKISDTWMDVNQYDNQYKICSNAIKSEARIILNSTKQFTADGREREIFPIEFVEHIVKDYGKKAESLIQEVIEANIYDLNEANYGFDLMGKVCLIDYGGYDDSAYWAQESDWT